MELKVLKAINKIFSNDGPGLDLKAALSRAGVDMAALNQMLYPYQRRGQVLYEPGPGNAESYIKKGYTYNDDIFSILNYIITTAAPIPWQVVRDNPDGTVTVLPDHPLQTLIDNPNPGQGAESFRAAIIGYKLLTGKTFFYAPRFRAGTQAGQAYQLYALPAHLTNIVFGDYVNPIGGYRLKYTNNLSKDLDPLDVCMSKFWNPDSDGAHDLEGLSPLRAAARRMGIANEITTAQGSSFKNMGPPGILARDGDEFTEKQMLNIQERFSRFIGAKNAGAIPMTGGHIKWVPMGLSPVDMNILESDKWTFDKLCNIYKFPAGVLNKGTESKYDNAQIYKKKLYEDCIIPYWESILADFNAWIPRSYDANGKIYVRLDISKIAVLQQDKKTQAEALALVWQLTPNQKLEIMGYPKSLDPLMDQVWVPTGFTPISMLGIDNEPAGTGENE